MEGIVEDYLKKMCVPCNDNGDKFIVTERILNIKNILRDTSYKILYEDNLCFLYGKKQIDISKNYILVSSHIDCLQNVSNFYKKNDNLYHGILDNAATNAAILSLMKEGKIDDNVLVVFTGDEEKNGNGARSVADWLNRKKISYFAIVLDVTSEGWQEGYNFTIENYFNSYDSKLKIAIEYLCKEYVKWVFIPSERGNTLKNICINLGENCAEWDEACDYADMGVDTFSICLPCSAQDDVCMHSNNGFDIRKSTLITYILVLERLLRKMAYEISIKKIRE
jgi:hypothetical protein